MKKTGYIICGEIALILLAFLIAHLIDTPQSTDIRFYYGVPILLFVIFWTGASLFFQKYSFLFDIRHSIYAVVKSSIFATMVLTLFIYFSWIDFSKWRLLALVLTLTSLEIIVVYLYVLNNRITEDASKLDKFYNEKNNLQEPLSREEVGEEIMDPNLQELVVEEIGEKALTWVKPYLHHDYSNTLFLSTATRFNVLKQTSGEFRNVVNMKQVNQIRRINRFFEAVNHLISNGGIFIDHAETYKLRKKNILNKYPSGLNWMIYFIDFIWKRIFPKIFFLRDIYFLFTAGYNRVLSKAEVFGRLYSCGFEIVDEKMIDDRQFFVARKIREPFYDANPTYGPLIRLHRYGKDGKKIGVYKLRTMHAYSEYLQEYIYKCNRLAEGGKFKDDFRVTTIGGFMRKFWIDELPMFINLFKGDMKLVGIRPVSHHYFGLFSKELQEKRTKHKPGLIPPFYVDLPKTMEEIERTEMRYLEAYEKHPFRTDWLYFWKAMYNIFVKKARSA